MYQHTMKIMANYFHLICWLSHAYILDTSSSSSYLLEVAKEAVTATQANRSDQNDQHRQHTIIFT